MARIKIEDLPEDHKISRTEMEKITGGTFFQNFDQKSNQLYNILSTVMKTTKEMESSVTRNML